MHVKYLVYFQTHRKLQMFDFNTGHYLEDWVPLNFQKDSDWANWRKLNKIYIKHDGLCARMKRTDKYLN